MASITDHTPAVGAVAWWDTTHRRRLRGPRAYVEQIVSPTEIFVSEDNWGGDFHWRRITTAAGGWPSGFIHFVDNRLATPRGRRWSPARRGRVAAAAHPRPLDARADVVPLSVAPPTACPSPGATAATFVLTPAQRAEDDHVPVAARSPATPPPTATSRARRRSAAAR